MADIHLPVSEAHLNDLRETVERVRGHFQRLHAECVEHGADWTPEQTARWEGSFTAIRGLLMDELNPLLDAWEGGHPQWRSTEKMLGGG